MRTQPLARPGRPLLPLAPLVTLALLGCNQNASQPPVSGAPSPTPNRTSALVVGPVQSAYLDALGPNLNLVPYTGNEKLDDYQMVIFDGDANTPTAVVAHPVITQALRSGKWVLGVDLSEAHKKEALGPILHASTCGSSAAYAVHAGYDANGRFQAQVVEPSRSVAQAKRSGSSTGKGTGVQPTDPPTEPSRQSCGGGADAAAQSLRADPGAASAFAKTLLGDLAKPTRLTPQDLPAGIPSNLIYATYYFTETFSQPLSGSLQGHGGTQHPNYSVNRTFTVFLNNKNNPQGDFQYVLLEQDAAANPKTSDENFIAMGTKNGTDWIAGTYDEAGWFQNRMQLSLWANPTDWSIVSTSPDTVNGSTSVTTGVSFQVGLSANSAQGPGGSASFTYTNSQSRNITDWAVDNLATTTQTQWMYGSRYPVDARYVANCSQAIFGAGCFLGQLPNAIAQSALKLYTQSVWKTPSVIDNPVGFSYWTFYEMLDVGCSNNGGITCYSPSWTYQQYQPQYTQGLNFDLGVVVPIPIQSITFSPNPAKGGTTVTGTVTLSRPAKIDTPIGLSSNSQNATVLPSVTVKQGQTSATFQVLTNTNGLAPGGSTVATIQAFYAQNYQAQLTVTN
ncbi:hypothetical protein E5F05_02515 (plasmid) [Deinococcus metallilatus]|uniref:Uncharacterized protein n=1 Tax=Deinococcus metallilatus TaxID=1211322 RepID=A0ABR6MUV0_9DEIO|nr:hypothetical protein [Deinococcus metallilatus]MBB5295723.1 hypothetical protein [Deinococcus metallilatus]QBY06828.1 hypothetical protein E5F05_02515 [Deinococcus metallilatus]GMA14254.1 hypothetical protein GCM10025871_05850 [Deinococcus metallilatus]